jgi:putative transposase
LTTFDDQVRVRAERARQVALFRYRLIQDVIDVRLTSRERGRLAAAIAGREHDGPFGEKITVSRQTIDRWCRWWRRDGFAGLVPQPAQVHPRTPAEVLDMAAGLKRENPARTATQVARILRASSGWSPSERTLQRHFERLQLHAPASSSLAQTEVFGRFEADRSNELWVGDALHGPLVAGRKTYLFAFLDDHSRAVMGHRFGYSEDTVRLAAALRPALASRGVPTSIYVDNGSAFVDSWLLRACASLGIKLVHSTPGRPQGRGKIERFFRTVREQFLVELSTPDSQPIGDLAELNRLFTAWVETEYHQRAHTSTTMAPLARWRATLPNPLPTPSPAALREAFLWSAHRTVNNTATVSLHSNIYQVDPILVGRKVELVFDPFDMTDVEVRHHARSYGLAVAFRIGRHSHPKARPEHVQVDPPPTGIDYLHLIGATHAETLGDRVNYAALTPTAHPNPDQTPDRTEEQR